MRTVNVSIKIIHPTDMSTGRWYIAHRKPVEGNLNFAISVLANRLTHATEILMRKLLVFRYIETIFL